MAKKKKNNDNENYELEEGEEKTSHKIITAIIIIVIILIWMAIFALLIKLDVGGFGSSVLRPILKDVPIINKILPAPSDEDFIKENPYPYETLEEAVNRIKALEKELDKYKATEEDTTVDTTKDDKIAELEAEIERLKVFEDQIVGFDERVKEFEENIVFADNAPSIEEYQKYYESIDPENAAEIYRQVIEQIQVSKDIKEQAERFSKMKPAAAARILETMTADLDLAAGILKNMKTDNSAAILNVMDPEVATKLTKKMTLMSQAQTGQSRLGQ